MSEAEAAPAARRKEAAVFDLDGTLVQSERRNRMVWEAFFDGHGIRLDDALFTRVTGRRGRDSLAEVLHLFPGRAVEELVVEMRGYESRLDLPAVEPVPGAVGLLRGIVAAGAPIALVTSAPRTWAEELLRSLGVRDLFNALVTAEDVSRGKPDPEGYLTACRALGADPSRTVGFEDAPAGVAAVKAAGMRCVAVATSHPRQALVEADLVVDDLSGLVWPLPDMSR